MPCVGLKLLIRGFKSIPGRKDAFSTPPPTPAPLPGTSLHPRAFCFLEPEIGLKLAWPVYPFITQCPSSDPSPCIYQGWGPARGRQSPELSLRSELCLTLGKELPHPSPTGLGLLREWVQSAPGREEPKGPYFLFVIKRSWAL